MFLVSLMDNISSTNYNTISLITFFYFYLFNIFMIEMINIDLLITSTVTLAKYC